MEGGGTQKDTDCTASIVPFSRGTHSHCIATPHGDAPGARGRLRPPAGPAHGGGRPGASDSAARRLTPTAASTAHGFSSPTLLPTHATSPARHSPLLQACAAAAASAGAAHVVLLPAADAEAAAPYALPFFSRCVLASLAAASWMADADGSGVTMSAFTPLDPAAARST